MQFVLAVCLTVVCMFVSSSPSLVFPVIFVLVSILVSPSCLSCGHSCTALHENLQGTAKAAEFSQTLQLVAQEAELSYRHSSMARARKLLAKALLAQIEVNAGMIWVRARR